MVADLGWNRSRAVELSTTESFSDFYRSRVDGLYRALTLNLGSVELAEEAVDEAMTRAFQRWAKVGRLDSPAGWVYRVAVNWARGRLRKRNRERLEEDWIEIGGEAGQSTAVDVDLYRALAALSPDGRSAVVLRYYLGWSTAETAAALGIKEGTLKSRLSRACEQLRVDMEQK